MDAWMYWAFFLIITILAIEGGTRFRRGTRRRALRSYRNAFLPAFMRNSSLFIGPIGLLLLPVLVLTFPFVFWPAFGANLPKNLVLSLILAGAGYVMALGGVLLGLSSRPPARLVPMWLREDDERQGYTPPKLDWFDALTLTGGMLAIAIGLGMLVGSLVAAVAPGLFGW